MSEPSADDARLALADARRHQARVETARGRWRPALLFGVLPFADIASGDLASATAREIVHVACLVVLLAIGVAVLHPPTAARFGIGVSPRPSLRTTTRSEWLVGVAAALVVGASITVSAEQLLPDGASYTLLAVGNLVLIALAGLWIRSRSARDGR